MSTNKKDRFILWPTFFSLVILIAIAAFRESKVDRKIVVRVSSEVPGEGRVYLALAGANSPRENGQKGEYTFFVIGHEIASSDLQINERGGGGSYSLNYAGKEAHKLFFVSATVVNSLKKNPQVFFTRKGQDYLILTPLEAVARLQSN